MSEKTGIEWTDSTWSPIRVRVRKDAGFIAAEKGYSSLVPIAVKMEGRIGQHCEHVSPGCERCYAGANNHRCLPGNGTGLPYDRRSRDLVEAFLDEKVLLEPLGWRPLKKHAVECMGPEVREHGVKLACACPVRPRRVFVENQSDLFGEWVTDEMLDRVFAAMALSDSVTFQVLTKRPDRMLNYMTSVEGCAGDNWRSALWEGNAQKLYMELHPDELAVEEWLAVNLPLPNVWLGVSVENQAMADSRIPVLLETPAAVRFISAEPLIGPVDLRLWPYSGYNNERHAPGLNWVICGGESGPGARPMEPKWARWLRDQCADAGVAFFMKQMGSAYGPRKGAALPADLAIRQFPAGA